MPSATQNRGIVFDNGSYSFSETGQLATTDHKRVWEIDLAAVPALNSGAMSTDGESRIATLTTGHTIGDATTVDVYWAAGARIGCTAAVAVNAVTLTGGAGDSLPADLTVVTLCTQIPIVDLPIIATNLEWLAIVYSNPSDTGAKASLDMHDAAGTELQVDLVHYTELGGCSTVYNVAGGDANPIDGDVITDGFTSHDSASAGKLYILALIDST